MEKELLRQLLEKLEEEGIEINITEDDIEIDNYAFKVAAGVLFDQLGTCPYIEFKNKMKSCCCEDCPSSAIVCWMDYIKKHVR